MAMFISWMDTSLDNQILGGDIVPCLSTTLSQVHRVSMGGDSFSGVENTMIVRGDGKGGGCGHGHELEGGRGCGDEGPRHCAHCARLEWAQVAILLQLLCPSLMLSFCRSLI